MSSQDGNYGEHDAREADEWSAYERDMQAEERDHERDQEVDRLRRDWPCTHRAPTVAA